MKVKSMIDGILREVRREGYYIEGRRIRSRKWLLTFYPHEASGNGHSDIKDVLSKCRNVQYWCMCDEVMKGCVYHVHLFILCKKPVKVSALDKRFPSAYISSCHGTAQECRDYIRKEGRYAASEERCLRQLFEESGNCPQE